VKIVYKAGRNDVKFELNGFGENENESPLKIKLGRTIFNRTVIIDIVPTK
jgi:hypothetical protein